MGQTASTNLSPRLEELPVRNLSNLLFYKTLSLFPGIGPEITKSTNQYRWICGKIRSAAERLGYRLAFDHGKAFSRHGSKFERTFVCELNDLDIYVAFDGSGIDFNMGKESSQLCGFYEKKNNPNIRKFYMGYFSRSPYASTVIENMLEIVREALPNANVSKSSRGVKIFGLGNRNYDIIPAFMFIGYEADECHIIPSGKGDWEINYTESFRRVLNAQDQSFPRDKENRFLSFKDMIRLLKHLSSLMNWEGLTSHVIKCATIHYYKSRSSLYNQKVLEGIIGVLNDYIQNGYYIDPIKSIRVELTGTSKMICFNSTLNRFL